MYIYIDTDARVGVLMMGNWGSKRFRVTRSESVERESSIGWVVCGIVAVSGY